MIEAQRRALSGRCLCGECRFDASGVSTSLGACHCTMCRQWGGGPLMAVDAGTDVTFTKESPINRFASSEWAERGFCGRCGTHLFYRLRESGQHHMSVGLFDDDGKFAFDHQVFVDERPSYYRFDGKTKDMTGAEVIALFGAS